MEPHRLVVVSDLHLGGTDKPMMSQATRLAALIGELSRERRPPELVLGGDVVDFLAIPEPGVRPPKWKPWTPDPVEARAKLQQVMDPSSSFACVFDALEEHAANRGRVTVLVGNHDTELTIPQVQQAFAERVGGDPHRIHWVADGSAYRVGRVLIEHGNRYDGANANDWDGLRTHRSALSRGEPAPEELRLRVSFGSLLVSEVLNPLKVDYPFLDLLQPQGRLLALLLFALEPDRVNRDRLKHAVRAYWAQNENRLGLQPKLTSQVSATVAKLDPELVEVFGDDYRDLVMPSTAAPVSASNDAWILWQLTQRGLRRMLDNGVPLPQKRLRELRAAVEQIVANNDSFDHQAEDGPYSNAARRLLGADVETVIMGHTHLARHHGDPDRATYINTGTWADVAVVPDRVVKPQALDPAMVMNDFLKDLIHDRVRSQHLTYADVSVDPKNGCVISARLVVHYSTLSPSALGSRPGAR